MSNSIELQGAGAPVQLTGGDEKTGGISEKELDRFDDAMKVLNEQGTDVTELDPESERRLVWRIDLHIMSLMCVIYAVQFLDKVAVSYASIMGMQQDIGYTSSQYSWIGSIFYFGYLAVELPTNYAMQRLPLGKWIGTSIILWGACLASTAGCTNYRSMLVVRFFLGCLEAGVTPAFTLFTAQWYKKHEQATRTGLWFACNGLGVIVGSSITYGIYNSTLDTKPALAAWKIVFLWLGLTTIVLGILFLIFMPDSPLTARFLKPYERVQAIERLRENQQGIGNKKYKLYQVREALTDPMTWAFCIFAMAYNITGGGITSFFGLLIKGLGYTTGQTLLYQMPGGALQLTLMPALLFLGDRYNNRILISSTTLVLGIIGASLLAFYRSNNHVQLAGYYLTNTTAVPFVALLSCIATNVTGYTKKTTVAGLFLISYCAGNLIGPQTFVDPPTYIPAEITMLVCYCVSLAACIFIYFYYRFQNSKKAKARAEPGYQRSLGQEFMDLTDRENPELIYVL